jgi:small conductance mechanosensitive channel
MQIKEKIIEFFVTYGLQILGALIILAAGIFLARMAGQFVDRLFTKLEMEPPIRALLVRAVRLIVMAFVLVLVLDKFGVPLAPMVAGIGVVGVGVGLALQGVLSNAAAGLVLIFTRPFRVGEYIEVIGVEGQVKSISLFATILTHPDQSKVVVPNRKIVGEVLHDYGRIRQLDLVVGVSYDTDLQKARGVMRNLLAQSKFVLKEPVPVFGITSLEDSDIIVSVKPWVSVNDFVPAAAQLYEEIIEAFRAHEIDMPYPQQEVRLLNESISAVPANGPVTASPLNAPISCPIG